jgi:hypothetical protein
MAEARVPYARVHMWVRLGVEHAQLHLEELIVQ